MFSVTVFLFVLCAGAPWARTTYFEKVSEHPVQTEPLKEIIALQTHLRTEKTISFQWQEDSKNANEKLKKAYADLNEQREQFKKELREYKEGNEESAAKCAVSVDNLARQRDDFERMYNESISKIKETGKLIDRHNLLLRDKDEEIERLQEELHDCDWNKQWYQQKRDQEWNAGEEAMNQLEEDKADLEKQVWKLEQQVQDLQAQQHSNPWQSSGDGPWSMQQWDGRNQGGWNQQWAQQAKR